MTEWETIEGEELEKAFVAAWCFLKKQEEDYLESNDTTNEYESFKKELELFSEIGLSSDAPI